jgi:uncharacterized protein YndB with AHSA1/START domain
MAAAVSANLVNKTRLFPATRERVFRAWTDERELAAWWCPGGYQTEYVHIDLRVGGAYELSMRNPAGSRQRLSGTYRELSAPERLVMTWCLAGSPADDGYEGLHSSGVT